MDAQSSGTLQSSKSTDDSSKSTGSKNTSEGGGVDREQDLTKDNAASPIDLECHIQEERITKIIDEAIYKTKLAICLPRMVQHYRVLSTRLSPQHMDDLIFIFEQYDNPLFSASLLNMAAMDDIKAGDVSLKNRLNPELGHLLYIMGSYPSLQEHVAETVEKMKASYYNEDENPQPNREPIPSLEYLLALEKFRDMMVKQMQLTAGDELAEKLKVKRLEVSNEKLIQKIQEISENLKVEQRTFESNMSDKAKEIADLEQELAFLSQAAVMKLKKKVLDSDRQMVLLTRTHTIKHEMLKDEEVETREGYNNLLRTHLMDEKAQRARRFKVETQLLSWLQKYDIEMKDKQDEIDDLEAKHKKECERVEDLNKKLADQDLQYHPLMKEKDEEYHAEMTAKMDAFRLEHAARVIQNAWRQVLANRAEKKKLKTLLKKVKAEREKQEKLREAREKKEAKEAAKAEKLAKKEAKARLKNREV